MSRQPGSHLNREAACRLPKRLSLLRSGSLQGEPRYPSFMGIRKAARAQIPVWSLGDLGIEAPESKAVWPEVYNPPKREVVCEKIEGDSPQAIAENLVERIMAEKIL